MSETTAERMIRLSLSELAGHFVHTFNWAAKHFRFAGSLISFLASVMEAANQREHLNCEGRTSWDKYAGEISLKCADQLQTLNTYTSDYLMKLLGRYHEKFLTIIVDR